MKKLCLNIFLLITNLYLTPTWAQELPADPQPGMLKFELNAADSEELFEVLKNWGTVVIDRQTQIKNIQTSEVICVENKDEGRQIGCSLYDNLHSLDETKFDDEALPLFNALVKHVRMDCDEDSGTCMMKVDEISCTQSAMDYVCSMEILDESTAERNLRAFKLLALRNYDTKPNLHNQIFN